MRPWLHGPTLLTLRGLLEMKRRHYTEESPDHPIIEGRLREIRDILTLLERIESMQRDDVDELQVILGMGDYPPAIPEEPIPY